MGQEDLRRNVRAAYSSAAETPGAPHPFPVGRLFAESLGYPPEWLRQIPSAAVDAFAGVSNVAVWAEIPKGATVLDMGCGAGLDSLLTARRLGASGKVMGVDFSESMLLRAQQAAAESGTENVLFCRADAERLPIDDGRLDAAVVNGIFNLNPARSAIFVELARCIRPGGVLFGAELILREPLAPDAKASESNWFA